MLFTCNSLIVKLLLSDLHYFQILTFNTSIINLCRNYFKRRNCDPINFEAFHENANWVLEDEPTNLTMEELETFQNELAACTIQDNENDIG